jgi:hypothetical protein
MGRFSVGLLIQNTVQGNLNLFTDDEKFSTDWFNFFKIGRFSKVKKGICKSQILNGKEGQKVKKILFFII